MVAEYKEGEDYDEYFKKVVLSGKKATTENDDDFLLLCVGDTGTGKTSLGLHAFELYDLEGCDVKYIGLDRGSFANAMKYASEKEKPRFCMNDEANVSKRDSLTRFNREMLDIYFANRGLNIFHWWNNPSLEMIDKAFIKERIKGVIFVFSKSINKPRLYYYFHSKDILKMLEKEKKLDLNVLREKAKKYAFYLGWFKIYKGELWDDYLKKKQGRMVDKVKEFYDKYGYEKGKEKISFAKLGRLVNRSESNIHFEKKNFIKTLKEGEHYFIDDTGKLSLYEACVPAVVEYYKAKRHAKSVGLRL